MSQSDQDTCYICLDVASETNLFMEPNPCNCRGTIKIHQTCYDEMQVYSQSCGICTSLRNGTFRTYWPNGRLRTENNYVDELFHGPQKYYLETGELLKEEQYEQDALRSLKSYYRNGNLEVELTCDWAEEVHGFYKKYYENGYLKSRVMYEYGKREGLFKSYNEDGYLKFVAYYTRGKFEGIGKEFYPNGALKATMIYVNHKMHGLHHEFFPNGKLKSVANYINGVLYGPIKQYCEKI